MLHKPNSAHRSWKGLSNFLSSPPFPPGLSGFHTPMPPVEAKFEANSLVHKTYSSLELQLNPKSMRECQRFKCELLNDLHLWKEQSTRNELCAFIEAKIQF